MAERPHGKVDYPWGFEIIWATNDDYCGKLLVFDRTGIKSSMVLHKTKRKSWFVNAGRFRMIFVDTKTGEIKETILEEGKTVDLSELSPHQLEALVPGSIILEVGTPDDLSDIFVLNPGDK